MLRNAVARLPTRTRPLARAASGRWTPRTKPPAPASKRLDAIGRAIFGTLEGNNERSGNKVLRKKLKGPLLADYYFDQSGQSVVEVRLCASERACGETATLQLRPAEGHWRFMVVG